MISKKKELKKPTRPLSAYNLFFRYERTRILNGIKNGYVTIQRNSDKTSSLISLTDLSESKKLDPDEVRLIVFRKASNSKRKHRKTHGKITFTELVKYMCKAWATLKADSRQIFELLALEEKERYTEKLKIYEKEKQKDQFRMEQTTITKRNEKSENLPSNSQSVTHINNYEMEHYSPMQVSNHTFPSLVCSHKNLNQRYAQEHMYEDKTEERKQYNFLRMIEDYSPDHYLLDNMKRLRKLEPSNGIEFALDIELMKNFDSNDKICEHNYGTLQTWNLGTILPSEYVKESFTCISDITFADDANTTDLLTKEKLKFANEERDLAKFLLDIDWSVF